jgi:hypothetical protein
MVNKYVWRNVLLPHLIERDLDDFYTRLLECHKCGVTQQVDLIGRLWWPPGVMNGWLAEHKHE